MSTRTSAIWKNMYDAVLYKPQARTFLGPTLSDRLDTVEGEIERRSDRLAQLHEERYLDNVAQKQGLDQRIPREWKLPGYGVPWHDCWGKIKTLLEPEYNREWHNAVAETKKLLALARDDANRLRGSILRSRINQLEQLVSDRSQSRPIYPASEPFIEGQLNETEISAFPDTGAAANFISLQYAEAHGLEIDRKSSSLVTLGNGSTVSTLGTTTALFSFAGEKTTRSLLFNVLRTSVYDVVLGSPFLQATETLTRYAHRIGRKCREAFSHRVCALGASQRVNGRLNGVHLDATPDTGSDVSLMPASLAARHKLKVNTDKQHLVLLEFADGSTARATGLVEDVEWAYGDTGIPYRIDVYVLPGLSVDLLFGYDFLHDTNAFVAHEADFWSGDDVEKQAVADEVAITWLFWIIKLARKAVKDQRNWGSHSQSLPLLSSSEEQWQTKKCEELKAYRIAKAESELLPEAERPQFMEPHIARWQKFLETHPSHTSSTSNTSSAASSSSSTGAILPPPAGPVQTTASVTPASLPKRPSKFRLGWLSHKSKQWSPRK